MLQLVALQLQPQAEPIKVPMRATMFACNHSCMQKLKHYNLQLYNLLTRHLRARRVRTWAGGLQLLSVSGVSPFWWSHPSRKAWASRACEPALLAGRAASRAASQS